MNEERIMAIIARIKEIMKEEGKNEALYTIDGDLELIDNIDVDAVFGLTELDLEKLHKLKGDRDEIEADESRQRRAGRNRNREEEEEYER